ncbi:hypothetical protein [Acinetobacter sp.]|uniref:hypothetical protein n=1 Tax=Acinetobacter sp. TaxID=472 RepID=UPI003750025E
MIKTSQIFEFLDKKAAINVDTNSSHPTIRVPRDNFLHWLPNFDKKDKELIVNVHGGGYSHSYMLGDAEGTNRATENFFFGTHQDGHDMTEAIKKLREKEIHSVHSFACNADGGGRPEFYEKLLGKDLDDVTMTPAGHVGIFGQQFTQGLAKLYNGINYITGGHDTYAAPQHHFHKVKDHFLGVPTGSHWEDQGEYYPLVDRLAGNHWVQAGVGVGMAGLAYGLYKKYNSKKKLNTIKDKVMAKKAQTPAGTMEAIHEGHGAAANAVHTAHSLFSPVHIAHGALEAPHMAHEALGAANQIGNANKLVQGSNMLSKVNSGIGGLGKATGAVSKFVAPVTNNGAFKWLTNKAPLINGAIDMGQMMTAHDGLDKNQEEYNNKGLLGKAWTGFAHPVKTLAAAESNLYGIHKGMGELRQVNKDVASSQSRLNDTSQMLARQQGEIKNVAQSPAYQQYNPHHLGPGKWRAEQLNNPNANFDSTGHYVQNASEHNANTIALRNGQSRPEEMIVQQPTPQQNLAHSRPNPNPGQPQRGSEMVIQPSTIPPSMARPNPNRGLLGAQPAQIAGPAPQAPGIPQPQLAGPAPEKSTLGGPMMAGPDSGGTAGGNPDIGKNILANN